MQKETTPVDISNLPELLKLAEEVQSSRTPRLLKRGQDDLAVLSPVEAPAAPAERRTRRTTAADPNGWLLRLADIGADAAPADHATDGSSNKYKYLADSYADLHQTEK